MKLKITISFIFVLTCLFAVSQKEKDRYVSFELAGSGGLASLNYEKSFSKKNATSFFLRTGFSYSPIDKNNGGALIFPVMVHAVLGKDKHKADFGIGQTFTFTTKLSGAFIRMPLSAGYRLENPEKRHYWRVSYTPIVSYLLDLQWQHWAGITYGLKL